MKTEYNYEIELQDPPNGWMCYKSEKGQPMHKTDGYRVELHAKGNEAHMCSCEFGFRQKDGQRIKRCKHVEMVLDEEFRRKKQEQHS